MFPSIRDGNFYWQPCYGYTTNILREEETYSFDAAVIGAGISGAMCALKLVELGLSVCIIDEGRPASGSTTACTAIVQYDTDLLLHDLKEKIGKEDAEIVYLQSLKAVKQLEVIAKNCPRETLFKNRNSLLLAQTSDEVAKLQKECDARQKIGLEVENLSSKDVKKEYPFKALGALKSSGAAEVDPVALTEGILELVTSKGGIIFSNCKVVFRETTSSRIILHCADNRTIKVDRAIYACGYLTAKTLNLTNMGALTSSYAGCTNTLKTELYGWEDKAVVWEVARPYMYMRRTEDNRIIIGGRDKPFRNAFLRNILMFYEKKVLEQKVQSLTQQKDLKLLYFWSGTFGESEDSLPFIGEVPNEKNCFLVMGTGGNGITFSVFAYNILDEWIKGKTSAISQLCRCDRKA